MPGVRATFVLIAVAAIQGGGGVLSGCSGSLPTGGPTGGAGTTGAAGTPGRGGAPGRGGTNGAAGTTGTGSGGGDFGQPACDGTVTKGGQCPIEDQLCYKTCGPDKIGVKSEICQAGVYAEMSGCSFDPARDYSCYTIGSVPNQTCPPSYTPQASANCDLPPCTVCNDQQGVPGGTYMDSGGAAKVGFCVCSAPNSAGQRTWSCASDTAWPCPLGMGCGPGTGGSGGTIGAGGAAGGGGTVDGGAFGAPSCVGLVTAMGSEPYRGLACGATDPQLCYKTCGPEKTGVKSETCTAGTYQEMSGCSYDPSGDFSCYRVPAIANAACPAGVTPMASDACTVPTCTLCNSTQGTPGGAFLDSTGAAKVGYCVCQGPTAAGTRTWSCASDTQWPCPLGNGC